MFIASTVYRPIICTYVNDIFTFEECVEHSLLAYLKMMHQLLCIEPDVRMAVR
jgi:hypothetical protein